MQQEICSCCGKTSAGELISQRTYSNGILAYKFFGFKCPSCNIYVDQGCAKKHFNPENVKKNEPWSCPTCGRKIDEFLVLVERYKDSAFYLEQQAAPVYPDTFLDTARGESRIAQISKVGLQLTDQRLLLTSAKLYYDSLERTSKVVQGVVKAVNTGLQDISLGNLSLTPQAPFYDCSSIEYEDVAEFQLSKSSLGYPKLTIVLQNGLTVPVPGDASRSGEWEVFERMIAKAEEAKAHRAPLVTFPEGEKVIYRNSYIRLLYYAENNKLPGFEQLCTPGFPNRLVITDRRVFLYYLITTDPQVTKNLDLDGKPTPYALLSFSIPHANLVNVHRTDKHVQVVLNRPISWWILPGTFAFPPEQLSYQVQTHKCHDCGQNVLGSPIIKMLPTYTGGTCKNCGAVICKSCMEKGKGFLAKLRGPSCSTCQGVAFIRMDPTLERPNVNGTFLGAPQYVHSLGKENEEWMLTVCEAEWGEDLASALRSVRPDLPI